MNLTEFGRGVHAEMEAILSAGRVGISVRGATLYTTTFPCHNCTKHIVDAGIDRVVYIEPYPKSLARELHSDSIILAGEEESDGTSGFRRIPFAPFVGIGPRRYMELFSMHTSDGQSIRRKDDTGVPLSEPAGLRLQLRRDSYLEREAKIAASTLQLTFI
jgi:Cytidine and deoxycytidylate deaminase zinc-binding region